MGRDVPPITVSQHDRRHYREKVRQCLDALARMLRDSWFETESQQVGLEVELHLVDESGAPSMRSPDVLTAIGDPHWAPELGQFNVEINVPPRPLAADGFHHPAADLGPNAAAQIFSEAGDEIVGVGIGKLNGLKSAVLQDGQRAVDPGP